LAALFQSFPSKSSGLKETNTMKQQDKESKLRRQIYLWLGLVLLAAVGFGFALGLVITPSVRPSSKTNVLSGSRIREVESALVTIRTSLNAPPGDVWPHDPAYGVATGVILSEDGLILTTLQATPFDEAKHFAILQSGEAYPMSVVHRDEVYGVAFYQIDAIGLPFLVLSEEIPTVGAPVIAWGNRSGELAALRESGTIIAKHRQGMIFFDRYIPNLEKQEEIGVPLTWEEAVAISGEWIRDRKTYREVMLTSLMGSSGFVGGVLTNLDGELTGMLFYPDSDRMFAVGSEAIGYLQNQLSRFGRVIHADLGLREYVVGSRLEEDNQFYYGALISSDSLFDNAPVTRAGLGLHDRILAIGEEEISLFNPPERILRAYRPGQTVMTTFIHPLGMIRTVPVQLEDRALLSGIASDLICGE